MIKALTAIALFLAFGAVALAKQTPFERPSLALVNANSNISSVRAMRENIGSVGIHRSEPTRAGTEVSCTEFVANLRRPRPDVLKAVVTHCGNSLLEAPSSVNISALALLAHYENRFGGYGYFGHGGDA